LLLIAAASIPASAADDVKQSSESTWVDPGWRRTLVRYAITFDEQGMSTTVLDFEVLALDQKGAEAISQRVFSYNSYFDELTAGDLATVKADGRVIAADARAVHDEPDSADVSSPYFDERRKRIVAYSDVAPGDKVRGRIVYKARRPEFPGEFAGYWQQPLDQPPEVIELTLDGPASKPLQTVARNVEHREERRGDRIVHHVRLRQDSPLPRQTAVGTFDSARRFEFSTFADYAAFAAELDSRNAPMAIPDGALRKLATEIVGDAATTARKVELLHNWVARNIRYVGIGIEDGGFTSQPAAAVLASRYGDCKAHATLLKALLLAQGIEANFVVVNTAPNYTLTQLATPNFDHAIVYVPELDQYLDPTASTVAFGALPWSLSGKPALNIDKGRLTKIPVTPPERFIVASSTDYVLAPDGTREARSILSGVGSGAALARYYAQKLERTDRKRFAADMIERAPLRGSGDYEFSDPRALSDEYHIIATFQLAALDLGKPRLTRLVAWTDPRPSIRALSTGGIHDQPFLCRSMEYRETASMSIPEGINFSEKVAPVAYRSSFRGVTAYGDASGNIELTGETVIDGRTIRSKAHLQLRFDVPVCPANFAGEITKALDQFYAFQSGSVGLTPKRAPYVKETGPDYDSGLKAYEAKDYQRALALLKPLAEKGHASAQYYLGWMYEHGLGMAADHHEAARWYRLAAEQGDTSSQAQLGYFYQTGLGVVRDDGQATQWYARSADAGDRVGQMRLAVMYRDARGVARDFKQAEKWLSMAADQDSAWAMKALGLLYTQGGDGVALDYVKAVELFRKASDRGDAEAQYNLGWAYESGLGVAKDRQQALEWYGIAAGKGHAIAMQRLDKLNAGGSEWLSALISWWPFFMFIGAWLLLRCLPFRA
jgi:TPR repeat protein/transglutaminase-like putative cysteine protease